MDSGDFDWGVAMDRFADRRPWVVTNQGAVHMGMPGTLHDDLLSDQMVDPEQIAAKGEYHPEEGITQLGPLGTDYVPHVENWLDGPGHHLATVDDFDWIPMNATGFENRRPWAVNYLNPAKPEVFIGEPGDFHPPAIWGQDWVKGGITEQGPQYTIYSYSGHPLAEQAKALVERQYTQTQHQPPDPKTAASEDELEVRAKQAVKAMEAGGFTLSENLLPAETQRYVVSISGSESLIPIVVFNADDILAYRQRYVGELMTGNFLGGWLDEGTAYLDLSQSFANKDAAFTFGVENGQQAIYDSVTEEVLAVPRVASADNWSTFENQETHSVDPMGGAQGLQPELPACINCGKPVNSDRDKLCIDCQSAGDKFVPQVTQPLKYFATNSDFWVYLDGKVGFGEHPWEVARQLAGALGYDNKKAEYISNTIAANTVPRDIPCAIGQMLGGRPQIWASTVDRNWVWDEVMRNKQSM